jgi:hypothetical protein
MTRLDRTGIALALVGLGVAAGIVIQGTADPITIPGTSRVSVVTVTQPPVTVTATVRVTQRASRSSAARAASGEGRPVSPTSILACIRKHESGGNYRAISATGKFRGAYQFHSGYAPTWATRAGYAEWAGVTPDRWPPAVQDAVAYDMGHGNHYAAWRNHTSYSCPWGTR